MNADVGHLNIHKSFGTPHGGGGPGMGPIGVKKHLIPYLPRHLFDPDLPEEYKYGDASKISLGSFSSCPYGNPGILLSGYCYCALLGKDIRKVSAVAILNSNYIKNRLKDYYPIVYTGKNGYVGHEFLLDIREIKNKTGISEEDIAKRLIDFGFHAPTISFPVHGAMMIEPTESEDKAELDRFCDSMIKIREEIKKSWNRWME